MTRSRTNIELDDGYLRTIMDRYGVRTKTEAVDLALRHLAGQPMTRDEALSMRGARAMADIPADVLTLVDKAPVAPGPHEVVVRIAVSGVNPTDWKSRSTTAPPAGWQTPDQDGAGTVDAVGEGPQLHVERFDLGLDPGGELEREPGGGPVAERFQLG